MNFTTGFALIVQISLILWLLKQYGGTFPGKLGCLFMTMTFLYHGLPELLQALFPDRNFYRAMITAREADDWMTLITSSMLLFTVAYAWRARQKARRNLMQKVVSSLSGAALLKWQIFLGVGILGTLLIVFRKGGESGSYWLGGLADQLAIPMLALSLATISLTWGKRNILLVVGLFFLPTMLYGSRNQLVIVILMGFSTFVRYGGRVSLRTGGIVIAMLLSGIFIISAGRERYGHFTGDESIADRLEILGSSAPSAGIDSILNDTIYRFDGNSFGAMVLGKQEEGYGITGLEEAMNTFSYIVPSFINTEKLAKEASLRNEENYQVSYYGLSEGIDYISDLWNLLVGYVGWIGMLVVSPLLGLALATLDNWLAQTASVTAYVSGVIISTIPISLEQGIAGIPYTIRGLALVLVLINLFRVGRRQQYGLKAETATA